jgi:hypothetical protein
MFYLPLYNSDFPPQFCDAAEVAIMHKTNLSNLSFESKNMKGKGLRIPYIFLAIYCPTSYRIWFALYLIDKTLIYNVCLYPLALYVIAHYQ